MISNVLDGYKEVSVFSDEFKYSGHFQMISNVINLSKIKNKCSIQRHAACDCWRLTPVSNNYFKWKSSKKLESFFTRLSEMIMSWKIWLFMIVWGHSESSDFSPLNSIYVKQRGENCCFSEHVNSADFEFEMTSGRHFIRSGWRKIIIGLDPKSNKPNFFYLQKSL